MTGLAGAALGGTISYLVSLQQITEARAQRLEGERSEQTRRSLERRFDAYARFLTRARQFRNAIRPPHHPGSRLRLAAHEIDALARSADAAGSLVFLVTESVDTDAACATVMRTIGRSIGVIHEHQGDPGAVAWDELNDAMEHALRNFVSTTRAELDVRDPRPVPARG